MLNKLSLYVNLAIYPAIRANYVTYNKVSNDHRWNEERNRGRRTSSPHAIPERLDPLPTQHSEHHHESVPEVIEVPARHSVVTKLVWRVRFTKHFHPHQSKDVNHKTQDEGDVSNWPNAVADC